MSAVSLRVTAPICSFRKGYARDYLETEPFPPPSTVYGFLLSLVGEEARHRYVGTRLALASLMEPELSVVLRTKWRVKDKKVAPGRGTNRVPDHQELLTGVDLGIWVAAGELADRLVAAGKDPAGVRRFGGLSLGESRDLINDVLWMSAWQQQSCSWLVRDPEGDLPLPVWVDHVGSKGTVWEQCRLVEGKAETPAENAPQWITIRSGAS